MYFLPDFIIMAKENQNIQENCKTENITKNIKILGFCNLKITIIC